MKKYTTDEFVKKAKSARGDLYDYSKVKYINNHTKISIICKIHGEFLQQPNNHLYGNNCPLCARCVVNNSNRKSLEVFLEESKSIHNNKYDYSKVNYKSTYKKVIIICKVHGQFLQSPHDHLSGRGCLTCGTILRAVKRTKTTDTFIASAQKVHSILYDYSKVNYTGNKKKVVIVCKIHKEFLQTPSNHLKGQGCPICKNSKGEKQIAQLLDSLNIEYQRELSFHDLLGKTMPLRFDFAITKNKNLVCLIEYDGTQHFMYKKGFHASKEEFKLQKKYDKLKDEYCKKNNIKLIRISYNVANVKNYLLNKLSSEA